MPGPDGNRFPERFSALRQAVAQSPATVMVTGLDGNILYVNAAFEALTGYRAEEVLGRNPRFLQSGLQSPAFYQEMWQTLRAGRTWRGEFRNRKKNGELFWEQATLSAVLDGQGRPTCYVAVKEDVSERKRLEQALETAKVAAEAASEAKSAFLANMSHDLRTPLNAIAGFIHLLQGTPLNPQQREFLDKAGSSAQDLAAAITDLLDFSRLDAERVRLDQSVFELGGIFAQLGEALAEKAEHKGLRLRFELDPRIPPFLLGDARCLGEILLHLGRNAVKFSSLGQVTVSALRVGGGRDDARLRIQVRDTGIGMTPEQVSRLFRPFDQGDPSGPRACGGAGMDLAISRRLAERMGGTLEVASEPGAGTVFTLWLDLPVAEPGLAVAGLDLAEATARLELDPETYLELVRDFVRGERAALPALSAALAAGNLDEAAHRLHALRGVAGSLGAAPVVEAARRLETRLAAGDGGPIRALLDDLGARLETLAAVLVAGDQRSGPEPAERALDPLALAEVLAALRKALLEDDAAARQHFHRLEELVRNTGLQAALAPLKRPIETYAYAQALAGLEPFAERLAQVRPPGAG